MEKKKFLDRPLPTWTVLHVSIMLGVIGMLLYTYFGVVYREYTTTHVGTLVVPIWIVSMMLLWGIPHMVRQICRLHIELFKPRNFFKLVRVSRSIYKGNTEPCDKYPMYDLRVTVTKKRGLDDTATRVLLVLHSGDDTYLFDPYELIDGHLRYQEYILDKNKRGLSPEQVAFTVPFHDGSVRVIMLADNMGYAKYKYKAWIVPTSLVHYRHKSYGVFILREFSLATPKTYTPVEYMVKIFNLEEACDAKVKKLKQHKEK